jgi:hypothetical protein
LTILFGKVPLERSGLLKMKRLEIPMLVVNLETA